MTQMMTAREVAIWTLGQPRRSLRTAADYLRMYAKRIARTQEEVEDIEYMTTQDVAAFILSVRPDFDVTKLYSFFA